MGQRVHRRIDAAGAGGRLKISYVHKGQRRENMMADALLRPFFQMGKGLPVLFQGNRGKHNIRKHIFRQNGIRRHLGTGSCRGGHLSHRKCLPDRAVRGGLHFGVQKPLIMLRVRHHQ